MTKQTDFFKKNSYAVSRNFLKDETSKFLYKYVVEGTRRCDWLIANAPESYDLHEHGYFGDNQSPGDFCKYGDLLFDTLLDVSREAIQTLIEMELIPTYSYHRLYTLGSELIRHKDRSQCEISTTLCLGYNVSNLVEKEYADWNWPMFIGPSDGKEKTEGTPINLNPGDMLIYRGCDVEHWREPFIGLNHAQVFLHYNDVNGDKDKLFDGRPLLGLGSNFKGFD